MAEPFEILAAPFTAWWAAAGTDFPLIDADPGAEWTMIGASGDENYDEDGVTVTHDQEINEARPLGSTGAVKAFRTSESLLIAFTVWDLTLETYSLGLNSNTIASVAAGSGTAGYKKLPMYRGGKVTTMALLVRSDVSPYGDDMKMQYEVPYCYMSSSPAPVYRKGDPAGLAFEFRALVDPNAASEAERFGRLVAQHQAPLE